MSVRSILEEKGRDVFTMRPEAKLSEAAAELASRRIGALVLLGDDGRIAGILSERDIVRVVGTTGAGGLEQSAAQVMTTRVVTCGEEASIDEVMETMTKGRFRHLPVAEDGRLVGIVSIGDVVKRRIAEAVREAEDMRTYITAGG
ncbi:CBS domain-containing protein [Aureimonas leprariae]|uniref:CBS domain-containing protein n=1 Tax=Plantimonas leprariae TaxID=2615207 RepID=A0A7V7U0P3_9HYPH|nr:CBS domain-containing protein [Aureimonas leprariae]KAB0680769.1 CBS domain-containing protein [Aureimonas leprariae]